MGCPVRGRVCPLPLVAVLKLPPVGELFEWVRQIMCDGDKWLTVVGISAATASWLLGVISDIFWGDRLFSTWTLS
jgi:hypothetical protein